MGFQDFDAARAERARAREPFGFTLGGESFECITVPIFGDELDALTQDETLGASVVNTIKRNLIDDDSRTRFDALIRRRDDPIDTEALIEVRNWMSEQYVGRPTERSNGSSGGPQTNGQTSTASSSEPDTATASSA